MAAKPFNEVLRISEFLDCAYSDDELMKLTEFGFVHTKRRNTYFLSNVFVSKSNFKPFPVSVTEEKSMNIIIMKWMLNKSKCLANRIDNIHKVTEICFLKLEKRKEKCTKILFECALFHLKGEHVWLLCCHKISVLLWQFIVIVRNGMWIDDKILNIPFVRSQISWDWITFNLLQ